MKSVSFIQVAPEDVFDLQEMAKQTFTETFGADNTDADMDQYLNEELTIPKLMSEINDPSLEIYFAENAGLHIGYITLHFINDESEPPGIKGLKIERLYLLNEFQGKGTGQELLDFAMEKACSGRAGYVWLGVWEKNYRAIRFYEKNGFVRTGQEVFILGNDVQTDYIMKKSALQTKIAHLATKAPRH